MEHWYAVHTKPRKERQVRDYLASRGITVYLPEIRPSTHRRGRRGAPPRPQPFFARYLFAHLDLVQVSISSVNWAPGVSSMVSYGSQPAPIRDEVIHWLQERLAQLDAEEAQRNGLLKPNDRLRIGAWPLQGMEAVFDRHLSGEGRARILVQMLDRLVACEIDVDQLERIG